MAGRQRRLLILYSFSGEEAGIEAPNFYRSCAAKVFPAFFVETTYLPNMRERRLFQWLCAAGLNESLVLMACTGLWVAQHGRKFDLMVGWLGNGLVAAAVKRLFRWRRTRICVLLYRLPSAKAHSLSARVKWQLFRWASSGADHLLALDRQQAADFAERLKRRPGTTSAIAYGVDTQWYDDVLTRREQAPLANAIFSPGSADRDDATLNAAIADLEVTVMRYQLDSSALRRSESEKIGRATIQRHYNAPYEQYITDCQNTNFVVIAVRNSDKPVGLTSLLECMALGKAVIITKGASSRDYVEDGVSGLLYEEGNCDDLRKKIMYLLDDPMRAREMGRRAFDLVRRDFGLKNTGQRFLQVVQNAAVPSISGTS